MLKTLDIIKNGRTTTRGLIIGTYAHLYDLHKHPIFAAALRGGGLISEKTRQTDGLVYIPESVLSEIEKFKVISGRKENKKEVFYRKVTVDKIAGTVSFETTTYEKTPF